MKGLKDPDRAKCLPLADLFMDGEAFNERTTRRQMKRLCESCPLLAACEAQAQREAARLLSFSPQYRSAYRLTMGFRAGKTPREWFAEVQSAQAA